MKRTEVFRFKRFVIRHDLAAHKVGTDAVLLGAWVGVPATGRVLDIGTGTGVIALMIAQRTTDTVKIDAIEIQEADAKLAYENVTGSSFANRIFVHNVALQEFQSQLPFDLIVSNPPYFINSLSPPSKSRYKARHTAELTFEDLIVAASRMLTTVGKLCVVLPPTESKVFSTMAKDAALFPSRTLLVRSRESKPVERILTEFRRAESELKTQELSIHGEGNSWSRDYIELTKEFYLNL